MRPLSPTLIKKKYEEAEKDKAGTAFTLPFAPKPTTGWWGLSSSKASSGTIAPAI